MKRSLLVVLSFLCLVLFACPGFADSFAWNELGSAGNLPGAANITVGGGSLQQINGNLLDVTEVDMFQITITDFLNFSATALAGLDMVDDPQLFLFDSAGLAVYMNDDGPGLGSQSELPSGSAFGPTSAGLYYLAIGWFDNEPFSATGRMFDDGTGTNGPGIGGLSTILSWNNDAIGRDDLPTGYSIQLTGASYAVPEPATLLLLTTGLALLYWRSRARPAAARKLT
ncbi:MAG TPA: DVUA0089 family protein [Terriglobia bacterium]|nr:DVUA0089 family protein [Terriglobia bacterium]